MYTGDKEAEVTISKQPQKEKKKKRKDETKETFDRFD